jgi:hypothetical protein
MGRGWLVVVAIAACSDGANAPRDAQVHDAPADSGLFDVALDSAIDAACPAPAAGSIGGPCSEADQCDSSPGIGDGYCLAGPRVEGGFDVLWPLSGYCTRVCTDDSTCGVGAACVTIDDGTSQKLCLPTCGTGACACPRGEACASAFSTFAILAGDTACLPGKASAADGDPCTTIADCGPNALCFASSAERPGGHCMTFGCTVGTDATCKGGGHCVALASINSGVGTGNVCVDACVNDGDCRQAEGYKCFAGSGNIGKFCRHPQIGDACAIDTDCGDPATWDCMTGSSFPNGMCTLANACAGGCPPASSACYDVPAGTDYCVDRCAGPEGTQAGCRTGYTCGSVDGGNSSVLGCIGP